jgi:hypothetical protein
MTSVSRSRLLGTLVALLAVAGGLLAVRTWLGGYVVRSVLAMAGASQIRHGEVRGTPWRLEVADLEFKVRLQAFSARRVVLVREKWWEASLGDVRVEGARMPIVLDGSDVEPGSWAVYGDGGLGDEAVQPPFRSLDLEGNLVVQMATVPDRPVAIRLEGRPLSGTSWTGSLLAEAPGFRLAGGGSLLRAGQELDFQVHSAELDLGSWAQHVQRLVPLPGGPWTMGGTVTGVAEGNVTAKRFAATARVNLRGGHMRAATQDVAAEDVEAELEFSDLWKLRTKSGSLRLAKLRTGRLTFERLTADFGLWNGKRFTVTWATADVLGGVVEAGPFQHQLDQRVLALTLRPSGLDAARLLALTTGVAPRMVGRVGGELALRLHGDGVQLTGGHLGIEAGTPAELQVNAAAMLRSGARLTAAAEEIFRSAGRQNVLVRLDALRLDVRPPGLPLGTSARLEAAGMVDGRTVAFSHHINGAVERHLAIMP